MKKSILIFLFVFLSMIAAQGSVEGIIRGTETGGSGALEIIKDWRVITIISVMFTLILVALASMVGHAFEITELKAWASVEFTQAIVTAVIISLIFVVINFLDLLLMISVNGSGVASCVIGDPELCAIKTARTYVTSLVDIAKADAKDVLDQAIEDGKAAAEGMGFNCGMLYCVWYGNFWSFQPYMSLDVERGGIELEVYQGILSSLYSQKYFVSEISFRFAPIILALGIVARAFFVTRRLGGLLIAIAIGVMFIFPAMYVFDWVTLNVTLFGDRTLVPTVPDIPCPAECKIAPPIGFHETTKSVFNTTAELTNIGFTSEQAQNIKNGSEREINNILSCQYHADNNPYPGLNITCPTACRDIPYQQESPLCSSSFVQDVCGRMPKECKVSRVIQTPDPEIVSQCPQKCKTIPPLAHNCGSIPACRFIANNCKEASRDDLTWRPEQCDILAYICPASTDPYDSCVYVTPTTNSNCEVACAGCPEECRITGLDAYRETLPPQCRTGPATLACARSTCSSVCKISARSLADKSGCAPPPKVREDNHDLDNCRLAPLSCRIRGYSYTDDINQFICNNDKTLFEATSLACKSGSCGIPTHPPLNADCVAYDQTAADGQKCKKCPLSCRFDSDNPDPNCKDFSVDQILDLTGVDCSLSSCPDTCRIPPPSSSCNAFDYQPCDLCPLKCRVLMPDGGLPPGCPADKCSSVYCPSLQCKEQIPYVACQQCVDVERSYIYDPPIRKNCAQLCGEAPTGLVGGPSPGEFAKRSTEGMIGREDIKNVSKLILPAYMLPLLNILVTIMFIKSVSPILGGDIEIPGIAKIL